MPNNIKEYNFQEFTDKDVFQILLAGIIPDFGYISLTKRKEFFAFCVDNGFIDYYATTSDSQARLYYVGATFHFLVMYKYWTRPSIFTKDVSMAIVYNDFKMISTRRI